jgi:hypothetical protein
VSRISQRLAGLVTSNFQASSWPLLLLRLWRSYVLVSGAIEAAKLGVTGEEEGAWRRAGVGGD